MVGTVGLNENERPLFTVYPNPANDVIHINADFAISPQDIKIKDIRGRDIETMINFMNNSISIARLSNGTYFIHLDNGEIRATEKFVIAR